MGTTRLLALSTHPKLLLYRRSETNPAWDRIYVAWDQLNGDPSGYNNLAQYNDGPTTLLHELFHNLGLEHTFGDLDDSEDPTCKDDDDVADTPTTLGEI